MKASLKNFRQAPRKMRLVADTIKGKSVEQALQTLSVSPKRSSNPLEALLISAISNAKNMGISTNGLIVKECRVDGGITLKRNMPGSRGSAFPIHKHTSHVSILLGTKGGKDIEAQVEATEEKTETAAPIKAPKAKVAAKKKPVAKKKA
jgi:large subunit ribosomal protein L22